MKTRNLKKELEKVGKELVDGIKSEIRSAGAIRTGDMLRSIDYKVTGDTDPELMIDAIYYYTYVDEGTKYISPREFTKKALNKSKKRYISNIKAAALKDLNEEFKKIFKSK